MKLPVFKDPLSGEPSFSLTVAVVAFTVVLIRWVVGGLVVFGRTLGTVSTEEITTWLTPTLLLYFGRQATKATEAVALKKAEKTP